jgi:hypothetical protein
MNAVRQRGNGNLQGYRILRNKQKRGEMILPLEYEQSIEDD